MDPKSGTYLREETVIAKPGPGEYNQGDIVKDNLNKINP